MLKSFIRNAQKEKKNMTKIKDKKALAYPQKVGWKERLFVDYMFDKTEEGICIYKRVKPLVYIILFLPVCLAQILYLLYKGGLKQFELPMMTFSHVRYHKNQKPYIENSFIRSLL